MKSQHKRPSGGRGRRKRVHVSAEGSKTEKEYFSMINRMGKQEVWVEMVKHKSSDLEVVLEMMKNHLKHPDNKLREHDHAWLVVDKDSRDENKFDSLRKWCKHPQHELAISNPCFEYWLLLHYREPLPVQDCNECINKLSSEYIPNYDKDIPEGAEQELYEGIPEAIRRARKQDSSLDEPRSKATYTTVYKLVEILTETSSTEKTK